MPSPEQQACAFLSTSFGFGPVSKAVSIAQELKARATHLARHYFGSGIDYDFAVKAGVFDEVTRVNVDDHAELVRLVPRLAGYGAVFSVLNTDLLTLWRREWTPLYFVDSLAWMWQAPPAGLQNVEVYFAQDYLLPGERAQQWSQSTPLVLVPPIETTGALRANAESQRANRLLVNFSGCYNPFAPSELFEKYVLTLASVILEEAADSYANIIFCCNERLARYLTERLGDAPSVQVGHYAHDQFLHLMLSSERLLTAPGITTTVEAISSHTPIGFLLPQNYSQALVSERYRTLIGDDACMAFSRFGQEFAVPPLLPEAEGVAMATGYLRSILDTRQSDVRRLIRGLLLMPAQDALVKLRHHLFKRWAATGQSVIVTHFLTTHPDRVLL